MADMIHALSEVAFGVETTPGTIVAADTGLVVDEGLASYTETIERAVREAPRGVLAEVEDIVTRKASALSYTQDLTFEELPIVGLGGLKTTTGGAGPTDYVWTFEPSLVTPDALTAFSWEAFGTDGTTKHYLRKFGFGQCSEFSVSGAFGEAAKLSATWFGRAGQTLASAASPAVMSGREIVLSELFTLNIDGAWADLSTTPKSSLLRSFNFTVNTGVMPGYPLAGRTDLDFGKLKRGMITGSVELVAEFDADAATEVAAWRAGTPRFISIEAVGTANRAITLQAAVKYVEQPTISEADGLVVVTLNGRFRYDATAGDLLNIAVTNQVSGY